MSLLEHATRNDTTPWFERSSEPGLSVDFEPSPAGPVSDDEAAGHSVPHVGAGRTLQTIRLGRDIGGTFFKALPQSTLTLSIGADLAPFPALRLFLTIESGRFL